MDRPLWGACLLLVSCGEALEPSSIERDALGAGAAQAEHAVTQAQLPKRGCAGRAIITKNLMQVLELGSDGSQRTLLQFKDESPNPLWNTSQWQERGDFVGGFTMTFFGEQWHSEYAVVDRRTAQVVFHRRVDANDAPQVFLGVDGTLAVAGVNGAWLGVPNGTANGLVVTLPNVWPAGPMASGVLPVSRSAPDSNLTRLEALFVMSRRAVERLPFVPDDPTAFNVIADRLFYVSAEQLIELGGASPVAYGPLGADITAAVPSGTPEPAQAPRFLLLRAGYDDTVAALDRTTQTVRRLAIPWYGFQLTPPHGEILESFSVSIDGRGGLLGGFAILDSKFQTTRYQLRHSDDLGATWFDVGVPLEAPTDVNLSWLVTRTQGPSHLAVTTGSWEPSTHYAYSLELISDAGHFSLRPDVANDYGQPEDFWTTPVLSELSDDGSCVATFAVTGPPMALSSGWPQMGQAQLIFLDETGTVTKAATLPIASTLRFTR
jgi:hypothetical protein